MTDAASIISLLRPIVYSTVSDFAASVTANGNNPEVNNCVNLLQQALYLSLNNSKLQVSGSYEARQNSTIAASCLNPFLNDVSNRVALQNLLTNNIYNALQARGNNNLSKEDINTIVGGNIATVYAECYVPSENNQGGTRTSAGIILTDSILRVGVCGDERLDRVSAGCINPTDPASQKAACEELAKCATNEGNITIGGGVNVAPNCAERLGKIALDVAQATTRPAQRDDDATTTPEEGLSTTTIVIIAACSAAALLLIGLLIFVLARKKSSATSYGLNTLQSRAPVYAQPAYEPFRFQ